jgi:hypothetical protein
MPNVLYSKYKDTYRFKNDELYQRIEFNLKGIIPQIAPSHFPAYFYQGMYKVMPIDVFSTDFFFAEHIILSKILQGIAGHPFQIQNNF